SDRADEVQRRIPARQLSNNGEKEDADHARFSKARLAAEQGRFDEARAVLAQLKPESRRYLMRDIALYCARRGDLHAAAVAFEEARAYAASLQSEYHADSVRTAIVGALAEERCIDVALRVARQILDTRASADALTTI